MKQKDVSQKQCGEGTKNKVFLECLKLKIEFFF